MLGFFYLFLLQTFCKIILMRKKKATIIEIPLFVFLKLVKRKCVSCAICCQELVRTSSNGFFVVNFLGDLG